MMPHRSDSGRRRLRHAGFTLVELLVALAIGLALILAITVMLYRYESGRRNLTATNDASMGTAYAAYILDRTLRSAGSGFSQGGVNTFGCRLVAARAGTTVLPRTAGFPAPFDNVPITDALRLAPVIAFAGAGVDGSDVLAVMTGSSGLGETRLEIKPLTVTDSSVKVANTLGLRSNDLFLVKQDGSGGDCMLQQAAAGFTGGASELIDFGGDYANASITTPSNTVELATLGAGSKTFVTPIGNTTGNLPLFQLIGVGANATLMAYDVLQLEATPLTPIVDGVADLRVLYGVDTSGDGRVNTWVRPTGTTWGAAALLTGLASATNSISQIVALRVGVLVRTSSPEKDPAAATTLSLFTDLPALQVDRILSSDERNLHWRLLDFTVPLRNPILALCPSNCLPTP